MNRLGCFLIAIVFTIALCGEAQAGPLCRALKGVKAAVCKVLPPYHR